MAFLDQPCVCVGSLLSKPAGVLLRICSFVFGISRRINMPGFIGGQLFMSYLSLAVGMEQLCTFSHTAVLEADFSWVQERVKQGINQGYVLCLAFVNTTFYYPKGLLAVPHTGSFKREFSARCGGSHL